MVLIGLMEDRLFFRAHIETDHERQEENGKCGERDPGAGDVSGDRRRLIFEDAHRFRGSAGKSEGLPDFPSVHILADGPSDFLVELLAGEDSRGMHIVSDGGVLTDANLPGKFPEDKICVGVGSLEVFVDLAKVVRRTSIGHRKLLTNTDVVPMSVIFAEVANTLVRIEWQLPQTTVSACPKERSVMAAPHFGQFSALACGFAGPDRGGAPALITSPRNCADFSI